MNEAVCRQCGIQLPLRRPRDSERQETWVCRNCGQQNLGLFDPFARAAIRYNCGFGLPGKKRRSRRPIGTLPLATCGG